MCGITGYINIRDGGAGRLPAIRDMVSMLPHRGPEVMGIYQDDVVGLGHARLSIIGLSNGLQPIANENKTIWMICNGETSIWQQNKEIDDAHETSQREEGRGASTSLKRDAEALQKALAASEWPPTPAPGASTSAPESSKPSPGAPKPASGSSTASPGAPKPAPGSSTCSPGASTSAPGASTPAAGALTPAPGAPTPAPGASTPAPGSSTPTPGASTPAPGASDTAVFVKRWFESFSPEHQSGAKEFLALWSVKVANAGDIQPTPAPGAVMPVSDAFLSAFVQENAAAIEKVLQWFNMISPEQQAATREMLARVTAEETAVTFTPQMLGCGALESAAKPQT